MVLFSTWCNSRGQVSCPRLFRELFIASMFCIDDWKSYHRLSGAGIEPSPQDSAYSSSEQLSGQHLCTRVIAQCQQGLRLWSLGSLPIYVCECTSCHLSLLSLAWEISDNRRPESPLWVEWKCGQKKNYRLRQSINHKVCWCQRRRNRDWGWQTHGATAIRQAGKGCVSVLLVVIIPMIKYSTQ